MSIVIFIFMLSWILIIFNSLWLLGPPWKCFMPPAAQRAVCRLKVKLKRGGMISFKTIESPPPTPTFQINHRGRHIPAIQSESLRVCSKIGLKRRKCFWPLVLTDPVILACTHEHAQKIVINVLANYWLTICGENNFYYLGICFYRIPVN